MSEPETAQRVLEVEASLDLQHFCGWLWQQGVPNRVYEERGRQVLEVAHEGHVALAREAFAEWQAGRLNLGEAPSTGAGGEGLAPGRLWAWVRRLPVLSVIVALSVLLYPLTWSLSEGELHPWLGLLLIVDVRTPAGMTGLAMLQQTLASGEWWRLVTPMLLHFGAVHLLFNIALCVEFGRRIELAAGSLQMILVIALLAVISNALQLAVSGHPLFGGLSGVVYGMFGYVLVRGRQRPADPIWAINPAFAILLVGFLILMSTGITEPFGLYIANTAHWAGFICGIGLALLQRPKTT